jgi:tetratricopeptide (TPR) repeat protein
MTDSNPAWSKLSHDEELAAERIIRQYEQQRALLQPGDSIEQLSSVASLYPALREAVLVELIYSEIEFQISQEHEFRLRTYLRRFPELLKNPDVISKLARAVWDQNRQLGRECSLEMILNEIEVSATEGDLTDLDAARTKASGNLGSEDSESEERTAHVSLGRFLIKKRIGIGSSGTVYLAYDPELDRDVAIKVPRMQTLATPEEQELLRREARTAARLSHPWIVRILEVGEANSAFFLVTDFIDGPTLCDLVISSTLTFPRSAELLRDVAVAIQHAHDSGVIHLDLKPSNILIDSAGLPRITDFGLARITSEFGLTSLSSGLIGTPAYMSPEQAAGRMQEIGPCSDVYALGTILYECLAGCLPFHGTTAAVLRQIAFDEPRSPRSLNPEIPTDLQTICLKSLSKRPADRYRSASELAADLTRYLSGHPVHARPVGPIERTLRWCRRNRLAAGAIVAAAMFLLCGSLGVFWQWRIAVRNLDNAVYHEQLAEQQFQDAHATIQSIADELRQQTVMNARGPSPELQKALKTVTDYYARFLEGELAKKNSRNQREVGEALRVVADHQLSVGNLEDALRSCDQSLALWNEFEREGNDDPEVILEKSRAMLLRSEILSRDSSQSLQPFEAGHAALDQLEKLNTKSVGDSMDPAGRLRASILLKLGTLALGRGNQEIASQHFRDGLTVATALVDARPTYEHAWLRSMLAYKIAKLLKLQGRSEEAVQHFAIAGETFQKYVVPTHGDQALFVPHCLFYQTEQLCRLRRFEQARGCCEQNISLLELQKLQAASDPDVVRQLMARSWYFSGRIAAEQNELKTAESAYGKAILLFREGLTNSREQHGLLRDLAAACHNRGNVLSDLEQAVLAEPEYREAVRLRKELLMANPSKIGYAMDLSGSLRNLALVRRQLNDAAEAAELLKEAKQNLLNAIPYDPQNSEIQEDLKSLDSDLSAVSLTIGR